MEKIDTVTGGLPRVLSLIDLMNLLEAAKLANEQLEIKRVNSPNVGKVSVKGNIAATQQSLFRSIFISGFAMLEQNLDELALLAKEEQALRISPSDLKDRGVKRSLNYAVKALKEEINFKNEPWNSLFLLQEVRNHLVHYGANFSDSDEHKARWNKFDKLDSITMETDICFTIEQIEKIFSLFLECSQKYMNFGVQDA